MIELLDAVIRGDLDRVDQFLGGGADPNIAHPLYGNTPLSSACFADRMEVVQALLHAGADPNLRLTYRSPVDGRTESNVVALMFAHSVGVVSALIDGGADANSADDDGVTPLMRMVLAADVDVVQCLLDHGANRLARDHKGRTAIDVVDEKINFLKSRRFVNKEGIQRRVDELQAIRAVLTGVGS